MAPDTQYDILVAGEINPDLILSGNVRPEFGQVEKLVDSAALTIGSSSAIFACGAARLGLKVAFIGVCGDDVFGRFMLNEMSKRGVDVSHVIIRADGQTGLSLILNNRSDRAILTHPGLIAELGASDIPDDLLRQSRHLHAASTSCKPDSNLTCRISFVVHTRLDSPPPSTPTTTPPNNGSIKGYDLTMPGGSTKTFFVQCVRGNASYGVNAYSWTTETRPSRTAPRTCCRRSPDSGVALNWQDALAWVQTRNATNHLGYGDWRMPNAKELQSILDYTRSPDTSGSAAIDPVFSVSTFTGETCSAEYPWYWASTTHGQYNGSGGAGIYVCFGRSTGYMGGWVDVHGAGAQRSDLFATMPDFFNKSSASSPEMDNPAESELRRVFLF